MKRLTVGAIAALSLALGLIAWIRVLYPCGSFGWPFDVC